MPKGFRKFLMRGHVIVVAVGLVVALAFSILSTVSIPRAGVLQPVEGTYLVGRSLQHAMSISVFRLASSSPRRSPTNIIKPLIARALGWQLLSGGGGATYLNVGTFISARA
jgi:hypothetical protein